MNLNQDDPDITNAAVSNNSSVIELSFAGEFARRRGKGQGQNSFQLDPITVSKDLLAMNAPEILNWILDHVRLRNNNTSTTINILNQMDGFENTFTTDLEWIKSLSNISSENQHQFLKDAQFTQNIKSAVEILQVTIIAKYIYLFRITTCSDLWQLLINIGFVSKSTTINEAREVRVVLRKAWLLLGTLGNSRPLLALFVANCATFSSLERLKPELINPQFLEYALNSPVKAFGRRSIQALAALYEKKESIPKKAESNPAATAVRPRRIAQLQPLLRPSPAINPPPSKRKSERVVAASQHTKSCKPIKPLKQSQSEQIPEISSTDTDSSVSEAEDLIPAEPVKRFKPSSITIGCTDSNPTINTTSASKSSTSSVKPCAPVPTKAQVLHAALLKQRSMPILEYCFELLQDYPDQIQILAPHYYSDTPTLNRTFDHRLQEYCQSYSIVYDREFLLKESQQLRLLPAYQPQQADKLHWYDPNNHSTAAVATKIWIICPDFAADQSAIESSLTNSQKAMNLYMEYYPDRVSDPSTIWDVQQGEIIALPAELLLKAGIHILLVIHRETEILSAPGTSPLHYKSPCAHTVHTVPDAPVFSAAGNYASAKHLIDTFQYRQSQHGSLLADEKVQLGIPGLSVSMELQKPTASSLKQLYKKDGDERRKDKTLYRRSWAVDLESPAQILYLLHSYLCSSKQSISAHLLNDLIRAHQSTSDPSHHQALAVILALASLTLQRQADSHQCQSLYGCGLTAANLSLANSAKYNDQSVFALSAQCYVRPLLFLRLPDSHYSKQSEVGDQILQQLHDPQKSFDYNTTRPVNNVPIAVNPKQTVNQMQLADRHYEFDKLQFGPLPLAQSKLTNAAIYIQDIHHQEGKSWTRELAPIIPGALVTGHALQFCAVPTPGVHSSSLYYYLHNQLKQLLDRTEQASLSVVTEQHNEAQRFGFWHLILPQCSDSSPMMDLSADTETATASEAVNVKSITYNVFNVKLFEGDIEYLRSVVKSPEKFLRDDLVDYMVLCRIKSLLSDRLVITPLRCGFLTAWENQCWNTNKIPKYHCGPTRTVSLIFTSDIVFIPVSFHLHYSLAVLYNGSKYGTDQCKLEHYDSLRSLGHATIVGKFCEALHNVFIQEYPGKCAVEYSLKPVLVQCEEQPTATSECGFRTVAYVEQVLKDQIRKLNGQGAVSQAITISTAKQWLDEILSSPT